MPELELRLPSGLAGRARGLKVREQNILADEKAQKRGGVGSALFRVVADCWLETVDPSLYERLPPDRSPFGEDRNRIDWRRVLLGDHFSALMQILTATYPGLYEFGVPCQACGRAIDWEIDPRDLPVHQLPKASVEPFVAGNRFTTSALGPKVTFQLPLAEVQARLDTIRKTQQDQLVSASLMVPVVAVEGVDRKDLRDWIEDLPAGDARTLQEAIDAANCGVETEIGVLCDACGLKQDVQIPFGPRFFQGKRRTLG